MKNPFVVAVGAMLVCLAADTIRAEPVVVADGKTVTNPRQPQAAVDANGTIFVTFGAEETIYCSTSSDGGESFSAPVKVADVPRLALGLRRGPRIVAGDSVLVVTSVVVLDRQRGQLAGRHTGQ